VKSKDYYYPIPIEDLKLNDPNLVQNPGWDN